MRRRLARIAIETGGDMPDRQSKSKLPGDPVALRGVPFQGKGIPGGTIMGTAPESEAVRRVTRVERLAEKLRDLSA
jgi:hypothetical protein